MNKLISLLLILIAIFSLERSGIFEKEPCEEPIEYSLGTFDTRFNLSKTEFLSALTRAEGMWETSSGIDLFVYEPEEGELKVNLIYDYRQEATEELSVIKGEVREGEEEYRAMEQSYLSVKREYDSMKSLYESRVNTLSEHNAVYEQHVDAWNESNRTSKKQFQELEAERMALEREVEALRVLENQLNSKVRELNSSIDRLNKLGRDLNLDVEQYNSVGASRGDTFAGGIYHSDEEGEGIDIYQFDNREKLVRILAHELGHALGLEHIEDPQAIMYKLNDGEAAALTYSDIEAVKTLCTTE